MKLILPIVFILPVLLGISGYKGPTELGNEAFGRGDYEEALGHYREAAEAAPESPEAHYNLGNALYRLGEYEKALKEYEAARELDPSMADAHFNAGDTLFRMEDYEDALKEFDKAKSLYGEDPDTEHNIEITAERIKKKQEEQKQRQGKNKKDGKKDDGKEPKPGAGGQGARQGQKPDENQGPPPMSNEELKALMDRQAYEEKKLRNYFQPGRDKEEDRESEVEQMLRGMGFGPVERKGKPGQPYVEKDW